MAAESGYSNQKKKGQSQFKTIQPLGSNKFGASVASKALYDKTAQDSIVVTPILGATGQAEFLNVFFAGHNAIVDDLLRITSGTFINFETEIVSIIDVDNFYIPAILDWSDISGENAIIMAWVTNKANSDGSQIVALAPTGIAFIQDASLTLVNEDTAVAANNIALPTSLFIHKDGVQVPITKDTGTPANTVGIPVEIVAASGTPINITAGDINVQLTDVGVNYDATRIGDGTNLLGITANNEALVHDTDVLNSVNDLLGLLPSAIGQQVSADSLSVALSSEQETILSDISTTLTAVGGAVNNTSLSVGAPNTGVLNIPANATYIAGTDGINLVPLSTDASGVLDVSIASFPLPSGAATEAKQDTGNSSLSSIDGKLQANGVVDAGNSSTTPLGISGVFTGAAFEITKYAAINVNVISNVASATNGVKVEFSPDGTNWDHSHQTTYSGGSGVGYIFNAEYKYARVVYANNTVAQASFRLQTIFKTTLTTSSLYTLSQTINANMFAALNRSVISGETTGGGGGYVNVKVNPSGALTVEADVTGTVSVSNFPATQPVSGSVSVSNFPATQNTLPQTDSGTITNTQATVGLTAVRATVAGTAPNAARKKLMIKPSKNNTGSIYFGSSTVTTANGMEVIGPDRLEFTLDASDYYLISDLAAQVCEIIEVV